MIHVKCVKNYHSVCTDPYSNDNEHLESQCIFRTIVLQWQIPKDLWVFMQILDLALFGKSYGVCSFLLSSQCNTVNLKAMFSKYWAKILGPNFQKFSCETPKLMFPILDIFIPFCYLLPWCNISTKNTIKTLHKTVQNEEKRKKYSVSNFFMAIFTN